VSVRDDDAEDDDNDIEVDEDDEDDDDDDDDESVSDSSASEQWLSQHVTAALGQQKARTIDDLLDDASARPAVAASKGRALKAMKKQGTGPHIAAAVEVAAEDSPSSHSLFDAGFEFERPSPRARDRSVRAGPVADMSSSHGMSSATATTASASISSGSTSGLSPANPFTISRYQQDFEELGLLGRGGFGEVRKCRNRIDGLVYAVKRIKLSPKRPAVNKKIMREVRQG